ncbi:regulator of G-protein signaling [Acrasis kona]|uniref:Regulator of G-protein signaling n=1 Tax=Acrasis kona TaxID=1008807 RepID=A0AAW2ZIR0_9EUKA
MSIEDNRSEYYRLNSEASGISESRKNSWKLKTYNRNVIKEWIRIILLSTILAMFVGLGVAIGLSLFFLLQQDERDRGMTALDNLATIEKDHLQSIITNAVRISGTIASYFALSQNNITQYLDYEPFIMESGLVLKGMKAIVFACILPDEKLNGTVSYYREWGFYHRNFTIHARNANNQVVPTPRTNVPLHMPIVYTTPINATNVALGFDYLTNEPRWTAIQEANRTRGPIATDHIPSVIYLGAGEKTREVLLFFPSYKQKRTINKVDPINNEFIGVSVGVFHIDDLVYAATPKSVFQNVQVTMFDLNARDPNNSFLFSSVPMAATLTLSQHMKNVNSSVHVTKTISVADRTWEIHYCATEEFLFRYTNYAKWLSLGIAITTSFIFNTILFGFYKTLQFVKRRREKQIQRLEELENHKRKLEYLLNRIAEQERITRLINNSEPDFIIVTNESGQILSRNTSFDRRFIFSEDEYRSGINVCKIFPELKVPIQHKVHNTKAVTRLNQFVPVLLFVRSLVNEHFDSFSPQSEITDFTDQELSHVKPALVLIARDLSENAHAAFGNKQPVSEFEERWRDGVFRQSIYKFALKENNEENILFLLDVNNYKCSTIDQRVDLQASLFEKYFGEESEHELNVTRRMVKDLYYKLCKSVGEETVFDEMESAVRTMVVSDIYPRFLDSETQKNI